MSHRQSVPVPGESVPVAHEQPDQQDAESRHVHPGVEDVAGLDQPGMREDQALHARLARQVQVALQPPDPQTVLDRPPDPAVGIGGDELPQRVEPRDERGLGEEVTQQIPRRQAPAGREAGDGQGRAQHDRPLPGKPHDRYPGLVALEPALRLIGQRLWLPGARPELRIAGSALAVPHVAQERGGGPDRDACRQRDRRDKDPEHQDQWRHRGKRSGVRPRRRGRRQRLWLGRRLSIDR